MHTYRLDMHSFSAVTDATVMRTGISNEFSGVQIDPYKVSRGNLYFAINSTKYDNKDGSLGFSGNEDSVFGLGGVYDGHNGLEIAYRNGAEFFVVDNANSINIKNLTDVWILIVPDSLDAIAKLARYRVDNLKTKVIGITGSTGKTSTTYAIANCLRTKHKVRQFFRTRTSYLGLIIDILSKVEPDDDYIVVEMQMDGPKQIARFCKVAPPDFAVITTVNNSHIERIGSINSILKSKLEIYEGLRSNGHIAINVDSTVLADWLNSTTDERIITYGSGANCDVHMAQTSISDVFSRVDVQISFNGETCSSYLSLPRQHAIYTGLAAASICLLTGFSLQETCKALKQIRSVPGRLQCFRGINDCFVLDDAYNANLYSMTAAINHLLSLPTERKIAFIGSMLELGKVTEREHRLLGQKLAQSVDRLIAVGEAAFYVADEAIKQGLPVDRVTCTDSVEEAIFLIPELALDAQTSVLVKGSGAMRMDRITPHLISTPVV